MRRIYTYILVLLALSVACQRVDLPGDQSTQLPIGAIGSKATITFSTADLAKPETRGVVDPKVEVETLHLIVFDENGMLVEVCEATELGSSDHGDHQGGKHYTVTLTVTDEPRIIHYVANCPVDQVVYGHETSIIGNMHVDRNGSEGAQTTYETSYWARIEVPYILVEEKEEVQTDGTKKIVVSLVEDIKGKFMHVPLLRNYAEITVTDETDNTFYFEGFTVYNLLNRGTVAPYNSNTQLFQNFIYTDSETGAIKNYSYPQISKFGYEGHALTSAQLVTDFIKEDDEKTIKIYNEGESFYVYERKVSVMTDEEEKWRESPPHIIIKGRYNHGQPVDSLRSPVYYYKMDLVYTQKDASGYEEIKYYNILRNFKYKFNLTKVHDEGYTSLELAVAGAAGNNISGSSSTSKLTNVSDNEGRLWVSHTDTTLVANNSVILRYKYIPNYYDSTKPDYQQVDNDLVRFENIVGDVITGIEVADDDVIGGPWKGYRNVTIHVNSPEDIIHQQILSLKTNSSHLNRQIRYTLRQRLTMKVECTPKVSGSILQPMTVDIKLPVGMTEDMFPLVLNMETYDRTLSPDATKNTIPVTAGTSIIDADGRRGELSYYYTVTIPTFDAYKALPSDGNMKVYSTYWLTNKANNASTFYVDNKYFNQASDRWQNYKYVFSNASCTSSALGVGQDVTLSFTMADGAINKPVTISLVGMKYTGTDCVVNNADATVVTYTPSSKNVSISGFKTTTDTDPVSFTLDADEYNILEVKGDRLTYKFGGEFVGVTSLEAEKDVEVDFTFNISDDAFNALKSLYPDAGDAGVPMFVTLDRMHPADNEQLVYSQARAEGDRYIYRIKQAGKQTIGLVTTEAAGGPCTVTLQADYFDTQSVTIYQAFADAKFIYWEDTKNSALSSSNMEYAIVGQTIRYYVGVVANGNTTSVKINNTNATKLTDYSTVPLPEGEEAALTTIWYIDWKSDTKVSQEMTVQMTIDGETTTKTVGSVTVDLILGDPTTSPEKDGKTLYVMQNASYNSTYCTSANNNLSASTSLNYNSLFAFESNGRIKSIAKGTYCNGTGTGNISFNATGTTYTFAVNEQYNQIYYYNSSNSRQYYIRQSNNTDISLNRRDNSNRNWYFYPIETKLPVATE